MTKQVTINEHAHGDDHEELPATAPGAWQDELPEVTLGEMTIEELSAGQTDALRHCELMRALLRIEELLRQK